MLIKIHKNKIFPSIDSNRDQAIFRPVKIANSFKLHHAFESAIDSICPAMIWAAKLFCAALRFSYDGRGVMPADIIKCAQLPIFATHDDYRLSGGVRRQKITF